MEEEEGSDNQSCPCIPEHFKNFTFKLDPKKNQQIFLPRHDDQTYLYTYFLEIMKQLQITPCVCMCVCINRTHLMRHFLSHTHLSLLFTWN